MRHYITPAELKDERTNIDALLGPLIGRGAVLGLSGLGVAYALGPGNQFWFALLLGFMFFSMLSLGGLWFILIKHLTRSTWSIVVRRIAEVAASCLVLLFAVALVIAAVGILGGHNLFPWLGEAARTDELISKKAAYLNPGFFALRVVGFFGIWILMSRFFFGNSVKQDTGGGAALTKKMWTFSAPGMVIYALTATFFSFDFLMSLTPHWFSTIFGVYFFAGCVTSFMALLALTCIWLQSRGYIKRAVTLEHYHDMGKLMFAFTFFWGYIAFSQFMLIWYSNQPEETFWFDLRWNSGWQLFSIGLLFVKFFLPFIGLMSRWVKKKLPLLAFWAVWILFANWYDLYFIIGPAFAPEAVPAPWPFLAATLGVGGFWVALAALTIRGKSIIPLHDPRIAESLAFENVKV